MGDVTKIMIEGIKSDRLSSFDTLHFWLSPSNAVDNLQKD